MVKFMTDLLHYQQLPARRPPQRSEYLKVGGHRTGMNTPESLDTSNEVASRRLTHFIPRVSEI
jgi:hypothetical protein